MKSLRTIPQIAVLLACPMLVGSCAKGPSGGPTLINARNRLGVTLNLQQPVNNTFYYDFAFDDDDVTSTGPAAIIGPTTLLNGVVGNSFTVLVQYHAGQFLVWRRTDLGNGQEKLDIASNPFVVPPQPAFGSTIEFTLDLDATTDSGVRLFAANVQRLDTNFVTTSEIRRDPNDLRRKPFDAFGPNLANFFTSFDIRSTQVYNSGNLTFTEPSGDVQNDASIPDNQVSSVDIASFALAVQRAH